MPLLLLHGWPGSVFEFLEFIPRLTDPARFGGDPRDRLLSWRRIAGIWSVLSSGPKAVWRSRNGRLRCRIDA